MPATSSTPAVPPCSGQAAGWTSYYPSTTLYPRPLRCRWSPHGNPRPFTHPGHAPGASSRATGPDLLGHQGEGEMTGCDSKAPARLERAVEVLGPWAPKNGRQGGSSPCPPQEEPLDRARRRACPVHIHPPRGLPGDSGEGGG